MSIFSRFFVIPDLIRRKRISCYTICIMLFLSLAQDYLLWHYSRAFSELFHIWLNFIWFTINFFSLPQLIRSWFSPWRRITEERGEKWDLEDLAGYLIIGLVSRLVGFIVRTGVIVAGVTALLLVTIVGFLIFALWLILPLLLIGLVIIGFTLLLTSNNLLRL